MENLTTAITTFELNTGGVPTIAMAFAPDSRLFAGLCADGRVRVWDLTGRVKLDEFPCDVSVMEFGAVTFSPSGAYLAASSHGNVLVRNIASRKTVAYRRLSEPLVPISHVAFNASETQIAVANRDNMDCIGFAAVSSLTTDSVSEYNIEGMILSLSAVGEDFFIELYSEHAREGTYPRRQYQIVNLSTSVVDRELDMTESFSGGYPVCSPNNKLVAIGHRCFASIIEVVCFESGETLYSIRPPENVQPYLAFSPNSRNLTWSDSSVINRKDKNCVYIHDAESGDLATRLTVDGKMHFLEYAPSGRILAVWAYSKPAISFWDAGSHQMLGSTRHVAKRCCFSSDSRFFASAAASIQIADLEPDICTGASKTT